MIIIIFCFKLIFTETLKIIVTDKTRTVTSRATKYTSRTSRTNHESEHTGAYGSTRASPSWGSWQVKLTTTRQKHNRVKAPLLIPLLRSVFRRRTARCLEYSLPVKPTGPDGIGRSPKSRRGCSEKENLLKMYATRFGK